ncbi:MAG: PDZ domain-containing protein [Myxococcota bacterium]
MNVLLSVAAIGLLGLSAARVTEGFLLEVDGSGLPAKTASAPLQPRSFTERSVIIGRNLFDADTLTPTSVDATESYEKTRLPLRLLATLAAGDSSWAAIEDAGTRQHLVARVNEPLCAPSPYRPCQYGDVILQRVERCRVVLENQNRREELMLEGMSACSGVANAPRPAVATARARGVQAPVQRLAENRFAVPRAEVETAAQNPAALYSQARILPRYDQGRMVGVQLNAIRPGSLFAQVGIQDGDTVTQVNGVTVSTPEDGQRLLQEFSAGGELRVTVQGRDGQVRELEYVAQ